MASCFGVLILLRYKISIIVKLEGHMKRQLLSRISYFLKKNYRAVRFKIIRLFV